MANGPKTITTNSSNANNNNNNKKETPKKKKRSPTGKLPGTYSPNSEPLALNNNNNNANNNNSDSGGSTLKSVVVTLTTPIATTTITISNVNLNNNNINLLEKQGSDAGSVLFTPNVRKHELPGCMPQSHHPPVLNNGTTGTGSPGRGVSTPSPPSPAPAPVVVAPPKVTTPASPLRQNTPPPPPPPPHAQHLPPPAPAPTIAHFSVTNGPLVGHPGLSNHPRLPTPPASVPTTLTSQSPRTTTSVVGSAYPPPPSNYPLPAPQLSLPPAPNPAYLSPRPVVTTSYAPPPPSSVYPPPHCTTGLSVTSNSNPVVVAAPSSYVAPSTLPLSNYPPLYAPYNSAPYLSSMPASKSLVASQLNDFLHQRMDRSPLPVISSKPAERPSGIVTTATAVVTTTTTTSHRDIVSTPLVGRSHSPRGHSPTRERDSYSSNVSSLSRGSVTPVSCPPPPTNSSPFSAPVSSSGTSSLPFNNKAPVWVGGSSGAQLSPANSVSRHPLSHTHPHPFPPPVFAPPVAAAPSATSTIPAPPTSNPNPFSAESLFQSNQADLLRRELDTRFLASQERTLVPPPFLRTEMHHHQHQHTHVHQHTAPLLPPPPPTLFTPPIFKDIPKLGGVDSPFYRQNLGLSSYPGFSPGLLHPTLGAATPFVPPNHLPTFTPKQLTETSKPKPVKTGKWNAMHVRIAWEIYHHQQKQAAEVKAGISVAANSMPAKSELLRPPTHLFPAPPRPHDLSPFAAPHRAPHTAFESPAHPGASPFTTIGGSMFGRYPPAATAFPSLAAFPHGPLHDPWSRLQPRSATFPSSVTGPWSLKPEPGVTDAEREREREREREKERERSRERERCRREEKQRKLLAAQQSKVRERSPLREPPPAVPKEEEVVLLGRPPPHYLQRHPASRTLPPHFGPTPWDHPYRFDPLRFNPLMAFRTEEEEQRAKLFGTYPPPPPHLRAKAPSPHRTGATLPHTHGHPDLHKKEESSQSR